MRSRCVTSVDRGVIDFSLGSVSFFSVRRVQSHLSEIAHLYLFSFSSSPKYPLFFLLPSHSDVNNIASATPQINKAGILRGFCARVRDEDIHHVERAGAGERIGANVGEIAAESAALCGRLHGAIDWRRFYSM